MNEELTAKEVFEIIQGMCEERSGVCDFGLFKAKPNVHTDGRTSAEEALEICKKWKAGHTPLEVEWVYICRIIEDTGNEKRCVYEKDIDKGEILPFGLYGSIAEEILKEYCKSREGYFFATVERICRKKEK